MSILEVLSRMIEECARRSKICAQGALFLVFVCTPRALKCEARADVTPRDSVSEPRGGGRLTWRVESLEYRFCGLKSSVMKACDQRPNKGSGAANGDARARALQAPVGRAC